MGLQEAINNIWSSDFVQTNPRKAYKSYFGAEYNAVATYLGGGPEPNWSSFSKLGQGLCEAEKVRRGAVAPPPDPTPIPPDPTPIPPTPVPPTGTVRDASPGQALSVISQSSAGETVRLVGGQHPYFSLNKSFAEPRVTVTCASGTECVGIDTNGQSGYIFDGCTFKRPVNFTDLDNSTFYVHGPSSRIRCIRCLFHGANTTIKGWCASPGWIKNVEFIDSEITAGGEDLIWFGCNQDCVFDHNFIHDPTYQSGAHQDCFQCEDRGVDRMIFSRNVVTGPQAGGGNSQCMMLGFFRNGLIVNNLFHHYGGIGLNLAYASNGNKIVNNTIQDLLLGTSSASISLYNGADPNNPVVGTEIWNNILEGVYTSGPSTYAFFDTNWISASQAHGGNTMGNNCHTGDPGFVDRTKYELTPSSPARSLGLQRTGTPSNDLDGNARPSPCGLGCRI